MRLLLNIRKGDSTVWFSKEPEWLVVDGDSLTSEQVAELVRDKSVCVLLHGYNSKEPEDVFFRIAEHVSHLYDVVIFCKWPGSKHSLAFWLAKWRAPKAGRLVAHALSQLPVASLDVEAHSLGCMVALEALEADLCVRNLVLAAAAVDNESIQRQQKYGLSIFNADKILVAYSRHDPVLRGAYTIGSWDRALGLTGPQNLEDCYRNIIPADCSDFVSEHSDYRKKEQFYKIWESLLS